MIIAGCDIGSLTAKAVIMENDKIVYVRQRNSLPANLQLLAIYGETDDT